MRTFMGMILGCLLTIGVVYIHDQSETSAAGPGGIVSHRSTIVNWDVASQKWGQVTHNAKLAWMRLKDNVS